MDTKTIFVLTEKGQEEVSHKTSLLYGDIKRALSMVDGVSTFTEISKRAAPSLRSILAELIRELVTGGFIEDKARAGFSAKIVVPPKVAPPTAKQETTSESELDFTTIMRAPSADALRAEAAKIHAAQKSKQEEEAAAKLKAEQEAKLKAEQEAKLKAEQEAKLKAEQEAKLKAEQEAKLKAEQEAKLKAEQEAKLKAEQEAKLKAEQEAKLKAEQEAKLKAEQEAKLKAEQEAKLKAEQEAKLKAEQEAKRKAEQEAKRKAEEEARVRAEKEEADRKARAQAEFDRLKAEQEAEAARKEAEAAKKKAEEEAQARAAAERKALEAAESAKQQAERLAAEAKAEAERIKKEAEQAKAEAERVKREAEESARKAKEEAEASRLKAEQEAARARDELEAVLVKAEQENKARQEAEAGRIAAEAAAAEARKLAEKISAQEREALERALEHKAAQEREEELKRAKQHALAAASTQIRDTPYDTSKPPESAPVIKLDDFDLSALEVKPMVAAVSAEIAQAAQEQPKGPSAEEIKAKEKEAKEHAKQAEAARLEEEASAKKLADTQAKAWAEAELRAAEAAKAHAAQAAQQAVHSAELKKQTASKLKSATKRKPLPWGGISVGLLLLAVLSLFIIPMALPTQEYAAKLEKQLSDELHQPVHVGKFSVRILPTPRIDLGEIYIGEIKQIKAQQAIISIGFGSLFGDIRNIQELQLEGAELNGSGLLEVPGWLQSLASDKQHPIARITFIGGKLNGDAVQFNDMDGSVNFDAQGKFASSEIRANSGKFILNIKAAPDGKLETVFNLHNSALPLLPNWNFEDMTANGVLTSDGLVVSDFDARISGGILQGTARLDWQNGWSAQGNLNAKTMTLSSISKLLEGDMDGEGRFKMQAETLGKLTDSSAFDGTMVVKKGVISGVNIIETARLHSKENIPGGRSHFDKMDGALSYSNGVYHFKSLKIESSVLNATGNVDIAKQQLSGRMTARLSIDGVSNVDLQVGGATDNPTLRATR